MDHNNKNEEFLRETLKEKLIKTTYLSKLFKEILILFLLFSSYIMLYGRTDILLSILVLSSLFCSTYCLYQIRVIRALKQLLSLNYAIGFVLFSSVFLYTVIQLNTII